MSAVTIERENASSGHSMKSYLPGSLVLGAAAIGVGVLVGMAIEDTQIVLMAVVLVIGGAALIWCAAHSVVWFMAGVLALRASADGIDASFPQVGGAAGLGATALSVLVLGYGVLWLAGQRAQGKPVLRSPLGLGLVLLVASCALSALDAVQPFVSLQDVARLLSSVVVFLVVQHVAQDARNARLIIAACLASALVPLLVGLVQVITGNAGQDGRLDGTFGHPNAFGFYLTLITVLSIVALRNVKGWVRIGVAGLLALTAAELLFTYSRTAYVAAVVAVGVVSYFRSKATLAAFLGLLILIPLLVPSVADRVLAANEPPPLVGTGENSLLWRFEQWDQALALAEGRELFGIGFGMSAVETQGTTPHNDYVRLYTEAGILGLLAYLGVIAGLIFTARKGMRSSDLLTREMGLVLMGSSVALAVFAAAGNLIAIPAVFWFLCAFAGVTAGLVYGAKSPAGVEQTSE